jgi:hypothetical protein
MSGSGGPLVGVVVEVDQGVAPAVSDSTGAYQVSDVAAGAHQLRFSRVGWNSLTIEVLVPTDGNVRLDVELLPGPVTLTGIAAFASPAKMAPDASMNDSDPFPEIGRERLTATALRGGVFSGAPDVFKGFQGSPGFAIAEYSTTPHLRGGSGDQTLTVIDGVPIYSPYHSTDVFGAVDPNAVAGVVSHTAAPPARFSGRLAGVLEIEPRDANDRAVEWRGSAGLTAIGQTVDGPLPSHLGGFLLSARRSYRDLFEAGAGDPAFGFEDRFGRLAVTLPRGTLHLMLFQSVNRLAFDGHVDGAPAAGATSDVGVNPRNRFASSTETEAAIWRETVGRATWETRVWHAGLENEVAWEIAGQPTRLASEFADDGVIASMSQAWSTGRMTAGVGFERPRATYDFRPVAGADSGGTRIAPFALRSARTIVSGFVEDRWSPAHRWAVSGGLRIDVPEGEAIEFQPRLSVRFAATPAVAWSVGFARTVQFQQSLRNEESVLDVIFGDDLLAGGGSAGVPVAHADQITAALEVRLRPCTSLVLDAYAKWLGGLALVAPVTAQPFATEAPRAGDGAARGGEVLFEHRGDRLELRATYAIAAVTRRVDQLTYHPAFAPRHTVAAGLAYRLGSSTTLGVTVLGASGRRTTPIVDAFQGHPYDPLRGIGDFSGSPQHWNGPVDGARLPAYLRLDVSVRHDWHAPWLGASGALSTFGSVDNVLGNHNALTYIWAPGTRQTLSLLPFSVSLGFDWRR